MMLAAWYIARRPIFADHSPIHECTAPPVLLEDPAAKGNGQWDASLVTRMFPQEALIRPRFSGENN
jgi:hypothetical protein